MNFALLFDEEAKAREQLIEENTKMNEELQNLSSKHGELLKVYQGLLEKNKDINDNHEGIMYEYSQLREEYDYLLKENPKKLKQIQEELIQKYNSLFEEHSVLTEKHEQLIEDHENLKKIPIIPKISSTEDLDLILDDQLRESNKMIYQEFNILKNFHENLIDELEEKVYEKQPSVSPFDFVEENKEKNSSYMTFSVSGTMKNSKNSMENSKNLQKSIENSIAFEENIKENPKKSVKNNDLEVEKIENKKIFEPLKIKAGNSLVNSNFSKSLNNRETSTNIFGPMRNNFLDSEKKGNNYKMYTLTNLPESSNKKNKILSSSNKTDLKSPPIKLSEFLSVKKSRFCNKLEKEAEIMKDNLVMTNSFIGLMSKKNKESPRPTKNRNTYYISEENFRGKVIDIDYQIFDYIKHETGQKINKLKYSCLKNKSTIFESETLQIGCISALESNPQSKSFLKLTLYFTNKTNKKISEATIIYIGDEGLNLWVKPEAISNEIRPNSQIRQELILDFNELPYPLLIGEYSYKFIIFI